MLTGQDSISRKWYAICSKQNNHTVKNLMPNTSIQTTTVVYFLLLISGKGRRPPNHGWDEMVVKGEMKMMWPHWWPGRRRPTAGVKVMKERRRSRSAVGAGRRYVCEPYQELSNLEGCRPYIPRDQVREMSGTAEEVGHRVVSGAVFGAGGVIGPAYGVTVGLEPRAVAGTELGEGAEVGPWEELFGWVNWRGWPWAPCWVPWDWMVCLIALFQQAPEDKGGGVGRWGLSTLTRRPLKMQWYEAWRVALMGRGLVLNHQQ